MNNRTQIALLLALGVLMFGIGPAAAQEGKTLRFRINAGFGATIIDLPSALGWDERYLDDWNKYNIKANLQCEFLDVSTFRLGAEVGYNRLYYYYVRVPYPPFVNTYYGTVAPFNISALGTFYVNPQTFVQLGVGPYFFEDGVVLGFKGALGYRIPVGENMAVPISAIVDLILGDGTPIAAAVAVGFEYTIDLKK
jgi:hypothetical protein